jgi:hypothetical protein
MRESMALKIKSLIIFAKKKKLKTKKKLRKNYHMKKIL